MVQGQRLERPEKVFDEINFLDARHFFDVQNVLDDVATDPVLIVDKPHRLEVVKYLLKRDN